MTRIEVGINLPTMPESGAAPANLARLGRELEQLGFESVWVPDVQLGDGTGALEAITSLAVLAGATERVRLGVGTLAVPTRAVAWLATQVATLQHLSGDRVLLGVGSGGFPDTPFWRALGVPAATRGRRTDETLRVLPALVAGERATVDGVDLTLGPGATVPPILVGGNSDVAIRRALRHDGWLPSLIGPAGLATRVEALRAAVERARAGGVGRQAIGRGDPAGAAARRVAAVADRAGRADGAGRGVPEVSVGGHMFVGTGGEVDAARAAFVELLVERYGLSPAEAAEAPMPGDSPARIAEHLDAYAAAGAARVITSPQASDEATWLRRCEVIATAMG